MSREIQVPDIDDDMVYECPKQKGRKQIQNKLMQTDDITDEVLLGQLREYRKQYGAKLFGLRSMNSVPVSIQ